MGTPLKDDLSKTPTRRTRRASSSEVTSGEPLTPIRRSRRLSGGAAELNAAPDGGIITGATPRRTPRGKRHNTSVQAEDVEAALAIAGVSQLPTLIEEEVDSKAEETEEVPDQEISVTKRPRGRPSKAASMVSSPSLNVISEDVEAEPVKPSISRGDLSRTFNSN